MKTIELNEQQIEILKDILQYDDNYDTSTKTIMKQIYEKLTL